MSSVLAGLLAISGKDHTEIAHLAGIAPEAVTGWALGRAKGGAGLLLRWQRIIEAMGGTITWTNFDRILAPEGSAAPDIKPKRTKLIEVRTLHEAATSLWDWHKGKPGIDALARSTGEGVGSVRSILQHKQAVGGSPDGQLEPIHRMLSALCIGVTVHVGQDLFIKVKAFPLRAATRERKTHRARSPKSRIRQTPAPRSKLDHQRVAAARRVGLSADEIARAFQYSVQHIRQVLLIANAATVRGKI